MPIPANKQELQSILESEYSKLYSELLSIPPDLTKIKTVEGNISVCDLIAYQIGWGELLLEWYESGKQQETPVLPMYGFKWNELGKLASYFYSKFESYDIDYLISRFKSVFDRVNQLINENSNEQLYSVDIYCWTGKWPLGRWINVNTSSPYKSARAKLRKWKKLNQLI